MILTALRSNEVNSIVHSFRMHSLAKQSLKNNVGGAGVGVGGEGPFHHYRVLSHRST